MEVYKVDVAGAFNVVKAFRKNLKPTSSLVFVSSTPGLVGDVYGLPYAAAKGAIVALVKSLAKILAPVRVNAVAFGPIETRWTQWIAAEEVEEFKSRTLLRRMLVNINKPMYVQKFLEKGDGDYRVVVVGKRAIGAEYRRAAGWKSNVAQGARPEPAYLTQELEELAVKAVEVLGLDFGGVDIAETKDGYYILEVNPTMSWQGFKAAVGINPAEHIVDLLLEKIKR